MKNAAQKGQYVNPKNRTNAPLRKNNPENAVRYNSQK